jgi:aspartate/methionine/tyrosine aminotransferase
VAERGIYLLSDEMYRYLEIEEGERLPAGCELYERAISLSGLSKSYGLPGLRLGWLASCDREVLERITILKDYTTICNSAPAEILALIALRNREVITNLQLARVQRNLSVLVEFFARHRTIFQWNRPRGGSICFPRMLAVDDTAEFCNELVLETGIMLVPSRMFQYGTRHVRVGFGREDLPQVVALFGEYLETRFR